MLTDGLDWETAITVAKLKKMVWGLETLQLFDERLSSSLSQIRSARESLEHTMEQVGGQDPCRYSNLMFVFRKLDNNILSCFKDKRMFPRSLRNATASCLTCKRGFN